MRILRPLSALLLATTLLAPLAGNARADSIVAQPDADFSSVTSGQWTLISDPSPGPPPPSPRPEQRMLHTAIIDPPRDRMLVFGGIGYGGVTNTLWSLPLSGTDPWSSVAAASPPTPRRDHTAIYDPTGDRMIIFGGSEYDNTYRNDTWALSLAGSPAWSQLSPATLPPGRFGHAAIYDPVRNRMIVFGGYDGTYRNDVWALSLSGTPAWTDITPAGVQPTPRASTTAIYDPVRDRMIFFGGWDGSNFRNDVWALSLSGTPAWAAIATDGPLAGGRPHHTTSYDAARDRLVISGGFDFSYRNDTWTLSLAGTPAWTQIATTGTPYNGRNAHRAVLDPTRDRLIVFGGYDGNAYRNDAFALSLADPPTWSEVPTAPPAVEAPSARRDHVAIYDPVRERMVVFGGTDGNAWFNDTWTQALVGPPTWTRLTPAGTPPPRRGIHAGAYDPVRDRLVVFGGTGDGETYLNDVWALSLAGTPTWTQLAPTGTPPSPRNSMTAVYDPAGDRLVIFGGWDNVTFLDDVWTLDLAGTPRWTQLEAHGHQPSARRHYGAIWAPRRNRMILFGGYNGAHLADTWELKLDRDKAQWKALKTHDAPSGRNAPRAVYDSQRNRMVIFGGYDGTEYLNDSWELSLGGHVRWTQLSPTGPAPAARLLNSAIYDSPRDRVLVFGGINRSTLFDDTWAQSFGGWVDLASMRQADDEPAATPAQPTFQLVHVFPNPTLTDFAVRFVLPDDDSAVLRVISIEGRQMFNQDVGAFGPGEHTLRIPRQNLVPGVYWVQLARRGESHALKAAIIR